jgi:hypothetical protein
MTACANEATGDLVSSDVGDATGDDAKADGPEISFTPVTDLTLRTSVGTSEEGRVIRSATSFRSAFGVAAPADLDFDTDWLAVYSAGTRPTGGFVAAIDHIRLSDSGLTVKVTSHLTTPGTGCFVNQLVTKPTAIVKFAAQTGAARSRFAKLTEAKACTASNLCDAELEPVLETQVTGMLYMSESDYPLTYVTYGMQGAPTIDKLRAATGTAASTKIEQVSFADLFDQLSNPYDPSDPYVVDYAMKYAALRMVLEQNLTDLTVIRVGEISIDVYIVGQTSCGELVGLKTTSIET